MYEILAKGPIDLNLIRYGRVWPFGYLSLDSAPRGPRTRSYSPALDNLVTMHWSRLRVVAGSALRQNNYHVQSRQMRQGLTGGMSLDHLLFAAQTAYLLCRRFLAILTGTPHHDHHRFNQATCQNLSSGTRWWTLKSMSVCICPSFRTQLTLPL